MSLRLLIGPVTTFAVTVLIGGFLTATLVRLSPGFAFDERLLDPRLNDASRDAIRKSYAEDSNVLRFYGKFLWRACHGDFGYSRSLGQPISRLLAERIWVTKDLIALGLTGAWLLGFAVVVPAVAWELRFFETGAIVAGGLLLSIPSTALALLLFAYGGPTRAAMVLLLFPQIFHYLRNILRHGYQLPHVLAARALGIGNLRLLLRHVIPQSLPQLLAVAGISVSMALGAAIPVEVISDLPGIGQLAWKAALARDLPVLVTLTLLITILIQLANSLGDLASRCRS